jgi:hypothetical protein
MESGKQPRKLHSGGPRRVLTVICTAIINDNRPTSCPRPQWMFGDRSILLGLILARIGCYFNQGAPRPAQIILAGRDRGGH